MMKAVARQSYPTTSPLIMRKKCGCGRPMGPTGECMDCRRRSPGEKIAGFRDQPENRAQQTSNQQESIQLAGAANDGGGSFGKQPSDIDNPLATAAEEGVRFLPKRKKVCLSPAGLKITLGTEQNDNNAATGRIDIYYQGVGRTRFIDDSGTARLFARGKRIKMADKKICDCDCMMYRQFLRGIGKVKPPGQLNFQPLTEISSGKHIGQNKKRLDGNWFEEDVSTIARPPLHGCQRGPYIDKPGIEKGAKPGTKVLVRLNFLMQVWDRCQQRPVKERSHTLTITGAQPPRLIQWRNGWLPLQDLDRPLTRASQNMQSDNLKHKQSQGV